MDDSKIEITKEERAKVLALQLATRDVGKQADAAVADATKFLAFLKG